MSRKLLCLLAALLLVGTAFRPAVAHAQDQIGILEFNPSSPSGEEFDIQNITGADAAGGIFATTSTYVTSQVTLSDLSLTVTGGVGAGVYGFTPDSGDTWSFDGTSADFTGATSAVLTGDLSPTTLTLSAGGPVTIDSTFSTTISDPSGLVAGVDSEYIVATETSGTTTVTPEPEPFIMVGTGLSALAGIRRRFLMATIRRIAKGGF